MKEDKVLALEHGVDRDDVCIISRAQGFEVDHFDNLLVKFSPISFDAFLS